MVLSTGAHEGSTDIASALKDLGRGGNLVHGLIHSDIIVETGIERWIHGYKATRFLLIEMKL